MVDFVVSVSYIFDILSLIVSNSFNSFLFGGILTLFHFFPSAGHGPLSWNELLSSWGINVFVLGYLIVVLYIKIEDSHKDSEGGDGN